MAELLRRGLGGQGHTVEVAMDGFVAVDVALHHFPVIDAGVAGRAGVSEDEAAVEIVEIDRQCSAHDTGGTEFNG